jgi:fatty-acyl-CoA synthase
LDAHLPTGHAPLTPTSFLDRSAYVYGERIAVVDGDRRLTYHQLRDRCLAQASVLRDLGVEVGDRVAVLARNSLVMLESHYGVPYAGAVLVALNVRLSVDELRYIVEHAGCTVIFAEPELRSVAEQISGGVRVVSGDEYELALRRVSALPPHEPDEYDLLAINYTSGTTGRPKGVMYHHRGAYLQALAMRAQFELTSRSGYLWTLPMFHCNGWCFTWAVTLAGGTHFCMPRVDAAPTWQILHEEDITHFCAAPTVLISLVNDAAASPLDGRRVAVAVGGAPPTPRDRRPPPPRRRGCSNNVIGSASTSHISTASPRRSGRSRSATGRTAGTLSARATGPGSRPARGSRTSCPTGCAL